MTRIGCARVSTTDQMQRESLKAAGCDPIREEKASGSSTKGRTELGRVCKGFSAAGYNPI